MLSQLWRVLAKFWQRSKTAPSNTETIASAFADLNAVAAVVVIKAPVEPAVAEVSEPVAAEAAVVRPKPKFLFSARIRSVARMNKSKARVRAARRTKMKPKAVKRAPQLYPVKNKKMVPKRAKTKIVVAKPKKSAVILRFPAHPQRAALVRNRRAA